MKRVLLLTLHPYGLDNISDFYEQIIGIINVMNAPASYVNSKNSFDDPEDNFLIIANDADIAVDNPDEFMTTIVIPIKPLDQFNDKHFINNLINYMKNNAIDKLFIETYDCMVSSLFSLPISDGFMHIKKIENRLEIYHRINRTITQVYISKRFVNNHISLT